jgi:hypothetical protein
MRAACLTTVVAPRDAAITLADTATRYIEVNKRSWLADKRVTLL